MDRGRAFEVLGAPSAEFRYHESKGELLADGRLHVNVGEVHPGDNLGEATAFEWSCGGAPPGTACIGIEQDGQFSLVLVCAMHAAKP